MRRLSFFLASCFALLFFPAPGSRHSALYADTSSANYQIQSDAFSAGAEYSLTSASYKLEESVIDPLGQGDLSSAGYSLQGKSGFAGSGAVASMFTSPSDFARFYTDENASYAVSAQDPDNDTLQYRAKQDGTTKAGPQASSTLTWALSGSDSGRRTHSLETIDPDGTVVKNQAAYVFRRPVK